MSPLVSVDDITAMSHRFAVKWSVPTKDLDCISTSGETINRTLRSNRYRFKNIKNLEFSYVLLCGQDYMMRVNCITDMPMFQDDALVLINDRVYRVQCTPTNTLGKLIFDPTVFANNTFEDDKVTFHCIMSIPALVKADIIISEKDEYGRNIVECESIVTYPDIYPHGYDAVNEFRYSSRIPDFNVKMAISLIGEAAKRHDPILKALCSEYLMENLTTENVTTVLKQSLESDARDLAQRCADFLAEQCKIVKALLKSPTESIA
ncbi:unnamed protein product [Larinioides sclopetarius]|uniref:Uncharacterized protein n=1 Tax=Larinioides sclopetarius TaxID=280406 RepID=A0AAV1YSY4_9ARAC